MQELASYEDLGCLLYAIKEKYENNTPILNTLLTYDNSSAILSKMLAQENSQSFVQNFSYKRIAIR